MSSPKGIRPDMVADWDAHVRAGETLKHPYIFKSMADALLEDWHDVCVALNLPHFLLFGTCLGMIRDKGYIKGDTDLDVGVLCGSRGLKLLTEGLAAKGIVDGGRLTYNVNYVRGVMLDVWWDFGPLHIEYLEKLDTILYEGIEYNVPGPVEDYLEFVFDDWRTPHKTELKDGVWLYNGHIRSWVYCPGGIRLL